ncbi:hypothetical protein OROHE_003708 [Orobanche hederae]
MSGSQVSKKRLCSSDGENSNTNIPKAITGWVLKFKSTGASGRLPKDEAIEINELINIHKKVDERIQKLHETLEDVSSKILGISEAKETKIQTRKDNSSESKMKESQVLTNCFKEGMSIRNTPRRGTGNDTWMSESVIAYQELRDKTENQAIQLKKLHEKLKEFLEQTMTKHEDMMGTIEAKKIPRKKEWSGDADPCTMKDLEVLTNNFSEENLIGDTSYGKLYRGKFQTGAETKDVVVKIWDEKVDVIDDGVVVKEEVKFLADSFTDHPNLPKLISFCNNGYRDPVLKNGVVYDVKALGRLCDYIPKDTFSWIHRFKVAYGVAKVLRHLQDRDYPYVIYNLDTENIVLNQEYCPVVVDFGLLFGGLKGGPRYTQQLAEMSTGYEDPYFAYAKKRSPENDVYSFGINLLALMAKRTDKEIDLYDMECRKNMFERWACREYKGDGCSLVNSSLKEDKDYEEADGVALTKLAMDCIQVKRNQLPKRPSFNGVVHRLKRLSVYQMMRSQKQK